MDTAEDARDYDAMDHAEVNLRFCEDFLRFANVDGRAPLASRSVSAASVIDFGTGTARIPIALCEHAEGFTVVAIDLAEHMLARARTNVEHAGLAHRIRLERVDAKGTRFEDGAFRAVLSNSIVHHIPEPARALVEMWRVTAPGGVLFVRDLHRPESLGEVDRLVALHAGVAPRGTANARQRELLWASLRASLSVAEVAALIAPLGIPASAVRMTSDRHWTLAAEKPGA